MMKETTRKMSLKINTCATELFCHYPILFEFYNVNEEPCNWISLSAVKVNTQK